MMIMIRVGDSRCGLHLSSASVLHLFPASLLQISRLYVSSASSFCICSVHLSFPSPYCVSFLHLFSFTSPHCISLLYLFCICSANPFFTSPHCIYLLPLLCICIYLLHLHLSLCSAEPEDADDLHRRAATLKPGGVEQKNLKLGGVGVLWM